MSKENFLELEKIIRFCFSIQKEALLKIISGTDSKIYPIGSMIFVI